MSKFKDLLVYKIAFDQATEIFKISQKFPKEETYSLTDQLRRSSRSVCANIAESYRKRKYPLHFISKLTDADAENSETEVWLDFALAHAYIDENALIDLRVKNDSIGRLLGNMINNPEKFIF
jgi:four helix bundle protein